MTAAIESQRLTWEASAGRYDDEEHRFYTDEWCLRHQARALENYDLDMAYFAALDREEFDRAVRDALAAQPGMREVTDLNKWDETPRPLRDGPRRLLPGIRWRD